jgi:CRISPR-associated protein Cmr2
MSHLLAISVGPVQEFIAAARRTRDLWFGSHLLSEISRAVAEAVERQGGQLIFPASSSPQIAENVANVILAELASGDPKDTAAKAKEAAQVRWREFAERARGEVSSVVREDTWNDQVNDMIEFYAAWMPRSENYQQDRARVMRLLAGRKNCRDFKQPDLSDAGLPKSSLDGQRPTVFFGPKPGERHETYRDNWPAAIRTKLRLSPGEQLDVVGVTKRLGKKKGEDDPRYPSVARVAAETWLRGIEKQGKLQPLKDACGRLTVMGLNTVREEKYSYFPYEGTIIYRDRQEDLRRELGLDDSDLDEVAKELGKLGGDPLPYVAVLVADGDSMGAVISNQKTIEEHQQFSQALAGFADEARKIVTDHDGVRIYAGGDDVLAFLPVHKCLGCARGLHDKFGDLLKEHTNEKGKSPTLSVGIAIGHFMESLEDLLEYGRAAEKAAKKPDRDGLAVHLHKRGGAPIRIRAKWCENPDDRLNHFAELMNRKIIPTKLPYELRAMAKLYEEWPNSDAAIQQDLYRLIAKKSSSGEKTVREELEKYISEMNSNKLSTLAEELLVARQIAVAIKQAGGEA